METRVSQESDDNRPSTAPVVPSHSTDLDVVNLSSQLISMDLLTTERPKTGKKRVRFAVPDGDSDQETSSTNNKHGESSAGRKKQRLQKTYHLRKKLGPAQEPPSARRRKLLKLDRYNSAKYSSNIDLNDVSITPADEEAKVDLDERLKSDEDNVVLDKNENCAIKSDNKNCSKGSRVVLRKSKSDSSLHDVSQRSSIQLAKKRKTVVAKKSCLRGKQNRNSNATRKRKYTNIGRRSKAILKTAKKRKMTATKLKAKKNSRNLKIKNSTSKARKKSSPCRSVSKAKQIRDKVKKAAEKVRKAKIAKQKLAQKRLKARLKRAAQKKLALKRSLAKKRKANKKKSRLTKNKRKTNRKPMKKRRRRRKIKIIPIERELDIVEPLRVSLLKYITFQTAEKNSYECCRKYCWDKWEEVEMEDIIDDHD